MAKLLDSKSTRLTAAEKSNKAADKAFVAALRAADDAAGLDTIIARVTAHYNVLRQQGEGQGKRFKGAKSHNFADQLAAAVDTFTRGNILSAD